MDGRVSSATVHGGGGRSREDDIPEGVSSGILQTADPADPFAETPRAHPGFLEREAREAAACKLSGGKETADTLDMRRVSTLQKRLPPCWLKTNNCIKNCLGRTPGPQGQPYCLSIDDLVGIVTDERFSVPYGVVLDSETPMAHPVPGTQWPSELAAELYVR